MQSFVYNFFGGSCVMIGGLSEAFEKALLKIESVDSG